MKRNVVLLTGITLFFSLAGFSGAAHVITMKNGSSFTVDHYWYANGQIRFYLYGGLVGFEESLVGEIHETDTVASIPFEPETQPDDSVVVMAGNETPEKNSAAETTQENVHTGKTDPERNLRLQRIKEEMAHVQDRARNVLDDLRRSQAANDQKAVKAHRKAFLELKQSEHELKERARSVSGGSAPGSSDSINSVSPSNP